MKSSAKKVELASVDDLFTTEQERQEAGEERVVRIPLMQLHYFKGYPAMQTEIPFTGQPYRVKDDDPKMLETLESVKQRGVRTPGLVRPDPEGGYEIISGHRRHRASELSGLEDMPVIIREMTDEEAVIELFDILLDDFQVYEEIRLTKGQRDITAEDLETLRGLRQRYLERREEEME